ncbi:MAG TPA: transcriptional repressor [Pseudonocardiaceae bacterium]|jgi:Fe2+ or Zn2+ uptake regulation protein|nr:transcriptional repressor [Pseudonocardiaceae bacterium]
MAQHDVLDTALRTRLRAAGLRVTAPRLAVLAWLAEHPNDTADAVVAGVRDDLGPVSTQAVHDVLTVCARAGLLGGVESVGHIVCRGCGRSEPVDCALGAAPSSSAGYAVDGAEVVFRGVCPDCRAARADI